MSNDFVAEILRATGTLRSGDPAGATAVIQAALAAGGIASPAAAPAGSGRSRKALGDVVRILAEGRRKLRPGGTMPGRGGTGHASSAPAVPDGAEFRDLRYSGAAGARRYRLYIPASASDGADGGGGLQGLVVMLHGCTQSPEDFAAGTGMNALAEAHRLLVVYPAQTGGDNSMSCWNWFRPGDQTREAGEPAIIAGLTRRVRDEFAVAPGRVFVAGLSAGGAMAAILGATHPDLYAAMGIHSGLAHGAANDVASAFAAMRGQGGASRPGAADTGGTREHDAAPRLIVFHGTADTTVHPVNAARIVGAHGVGPAQATQSEHTAADGRRGYTRMVSLQDDGVPRLECWMIEGAQHAWSGGQPGGSYTDPQGPDASAEMVRFFLGEAATGVSIR